MWPLKRPEVLVWLLVALVVDQLLWWLILTIRLRRCPVHRLAAAAQRIAAVVHSIAMPPLTIRVIINGFRSPTAVALFEE
jgi:hypothetical protein